MFKSDAPKLSSAKNNNPGPGQYNQILENIKVQHKLVAFDSSEGKLKHMATKKGAILTSSNHLDVGPGNYNVDSVKAIEMNRGNFGSNKERFDENAYGGGSGNQNLGPGDYDGESKWDKKSYNV
eukprot:CAMPEP_0116947108 /NCGR_PEP_ID=MMETSP0467-20121206/37451_1 /TAXON_ID=283647 /ORGANISM="Mesodinium pulex, Strain SPMC105" /LENGTH=123 /DNA_ID=CAMNT_0004631147 /DNA_START=1161 /DNA_END=1532 /DNA_ORIENTATION=-